MKTEYTPVVTATSAFSRKKIYSKGERPTVTLVKTAVKHAKEFRRRIGGEL